MRLFILKFAVAAGAAMAIQAHADDSLPPKVFTDVSVTLQSRACGELMTGLALGGVQALKMQFPTGTIPEMERKAVYEAAAQAVVLLTKSGSLKLEDRLKAGEIAAAIDKMDPQVHVDTAKFCQRRVEAWIHAGEVDKALVSNAYSQAQQMMDRALAVKGPEDLVQ